VKQSITIVLLVTILLQSCVAYQKTSVSIDEANMTGEVKIMTTKGEKIKLKNIELEEGIYYGFDGKNEVRLDPDQISSIYLKDHEKSRKQTAWMRVPAYIFLAALAISALISWLEDQKTK